MVAQLVPKDGQYVLNHCTKYLARQQMNARHNFGQYADGDTRAAICEAWRFPVIDSYSDGISASGSYAYNTVTFVYDGRENMPNDVSVVGTFAELYEPVALNPVEFLTTPTGLFSVALRIPKAQVHFYKFRVDGKYMPDPVNPQLATMDNGEQWSRFFTDDCQVPLELSRRERDLLGRIVRHILPFRLPENRQFISKVYNALDRVDREEQFPIAYRLDEEVGVVNYIDKVIGREERHNAYAYHTCLSIIDGLLRSRHGGLDPVTLPSEVFDDLYTEMGTDYVTGWDVVRYGSPRFFLMMLRRHAMTGAFVHPKHGGNSGAAGWSYLEDQFTDDRGQTLFDWRRAIEAPLGHNTDYRG